MNSSVFDNVARRVRLATDFDALTRVVRISHRLHWHVDEHVCQFRGEPHGLQITWMKGRNKVSRYLFFVNGKRHGYKLRYDQFDETWTIVKQYAHDKRHGTCGYTTDHVRCYRRYVHGRLVEYIWWRDGQLSSYTLMAARGKRVQYDEGGTFFITAEPYYSCDTEYPWVSVGSDLWNHVASRLTWPSDFDSFSRVIPTISSGAWTRHKYGWRYRGLRHGVFNPPDELRNYCDDQLHGFLFTPRKEVRIVHYDRGIVHGYCEMTFHGRNLFMFYRHGHRHGLCTEASLMCSDVISHGVYVSGLRHGRHFKWHGDGKLISTCVYNMGAREGSYICSQAAIPVKPYYNGRLQGLIVDGLSRRYYHRSELHGPLITYHCNDRLEEVSCYRYGKQIAPRWRWTRDGTLIDYSEPDGWEMVLARGQWNYRHRSGIFIANGTVCHLPLLSQW
jgi:hypothetical protein